MAEQDRRFDVFLSYNTNDRPAAIRLAERLQAQGLRVWLDIWELPPGRPWADALMKNIHSISSAAALVGQDGYGPWQHWEARGCLKRFAKDGRPVIPVLLEGCPDVPELPFFLDQVAWVDCRSGQSDEGFWRLVWGITGRKPAAISRPGEAAEENQSANSPDQNSAAPQTEAAAPPPAPQPASENVPRGTQAPPPAPVAETQPTPAPSALEIFRDSMKDGGTGPEMVVVPRGSFRMGDHGGGHNNELPVHTVNIAGAFAIGRFAVTFEEYDRFAQATGRPLPNDFTWGRGRRPVVGVSWEDACAYAAWLAEQTGKAYCLPSEAEWEYAARAGTETAYWWGDDIGQNRANCDGSGSEWSGKQTAPVGSFAANPWGLHDTAGNVWEWVQDPWHNSYAQAPEDGSAWEVRGTSNRVLRGGSWYFSPRHARSACRLNDAPGIRNHNVGFRLACSLPAA